MKITFLNSIFTLSCIAGLTFGCRRSNKSSSNHETTPTMSLSIVSSQSNAPLAFERIPMPSQSRLFPLEEGTLWVWPESDPTTHTYRLRAQPLDAWGIRKGTAILICELSVPISAWSVSASRETIWVAWMTKEERRNAELTTHASVYVQTLRGNDFKMGSRRDLAHYQDVHVTDLTSVIQVLALDPQNAFIAVSGETLLAFSNDTYGTYRWTVDIDFYKLNELESLIHSTKIGQSMVSEISEPAVVSPLIPVKNETFAYITYSTIFHRQFNIFDKSKLEFAEVTNDFSLTKEPIYKLIYQDSQWVMLYYATDQESDAGWPLSVFVHQGEPASIATAYSHRKQKHDPVVKVHEVRCDRDIPLEYFEWKEGSFLFDVRKHSIAMRTVWDGVWSGRVVLSIRNGALARSQCKNGQWVQE